MIVIYSRPSCAPCRTLKLYLDRKGLQYEVKDADDNREELLKYSNAFVVPITVIDQDPTKVIEGLNLKRLGEILNG
jgi:glutaredoxin